MLEVRPEVEWLRGTALRDGKGGRGTALRGTALRDGKGGVGREGEKRGIGRVKVGRRGAAAGWPPFGCDGWCGADVPAAGVRLRKKIAIEEEPLQFGGGGFRAVAGVADVDHLIDPEVAADGAFFGDA